MRNSTSIPSANSKIIHTKQTVGTSTMCPTWHSKSRSPRHPFILTSRVRRCSTPAWWMLSTKRLGKLQLQRETTLSTIHSGQTPVTSHSQWRHKRAQLLCLTQWVRRTSWTTCCCQTRQLSHSSLLNIPIPMERMLTITLHRVHTQFSLMKKQPSRREMSATRNSTMRTWP